MKWKVYKRDRARQEESEKNLEIFAGEDERQNSFLSSWLGDPASGYFGSVGVISLRPDISNKNYILFVTKHLSRPRHGKIVTATELILHPSVTNISFSSESINQTDHLEHFSSNWGLKMNAANLLGLTDLFSFLLRKSDFSYI